MPLDAEIRDAAGLRSDSGDLLDVLGKVVAAPVNLAVGAADAIGDVLSSVVDRLPGPVRDAIKGGASILVASTRLVPIGPLGSTVFSADVLGRVGRGEPLDDALRAVAGPLVAAYSEALPAAGLGFLSGGPVGAGAAFAGTMAPRILAEAGIDSPLSRSVTQLVIGAAATGKLPDVQRTIGALGPTLGVAPNGPTAQALASLSGAVGSGRVPTAAEAERLARSLATEARGRLGAAANAQAAITAVAQAVPPAQIALAGIGGNPYVAAARSLSSAVSKLAAQATAAAQAAADERLRADLAARNPGVGPLDAYARGLASMPVLTLEDPRVTAQRAAQAAAAQAASDDRSRLMGRLPDGPDTQRMRVLLTQWLADKGQRASVGTSPQNTVGSWGISMMLLARDPGAAPYAIPAGVQYATVGALRFLEAKYPVLAGLDRAAQPPSPTASPAPLSPSAATAPGVRTDPVAIVRGLLP